MKLSNLALPLLASSALAQNSTNSTNPNSNTTIIVTNDDSWASANIRALYSELKNEGYNVFIFAPAVQQSGTGGTFNLPRAANLTTGGEFGSLPVGAPNWGQDENDDHIWYFDGTPAAAMSFGLDYAIPRLFNNATVDLVISGPNEGWNIGPNIYTMSGTNGAMYQAVARGIPAMAYSGMNPHQYYANASTSANAAHNIYAKTAAGIVKNLVNNSKDRATLLPYGVGLSINLPRAGDVDPTGKCKEIKPIFTRQTGPAAIVLKLSYNETTNRFTPGITNSEATKACLNGDCLLPDESDVVSNWGCHASVSVVTTDYDAPRDVAGEVQFLNRGEVQFAPRVYGSFAPVGIAAYF
ncbi:Acid phosphatase [Yarrowia sp. E02]|nr:Acid phosphatase [Yarrowia sp. E02]